MTRDDIIAGLRAAADYLEAHPDLPADAYAPTSVWHFVGSKDRNTARAEVDAVAALIGTVPDGRGEHYETHLNFGAVDYRVAAIHMGDTAQATPERSAA